jgi:hypothetical protein
MVKEDIRKSEKKYKEWRASLGSSPHFSTQPLTPCSLGNPITRSPWRRPGQGFKAGE